MLNGPIRGQQIKANVYEIHSDNRYLGNPHHNGCLIVHLRLPFFKIGNDFLSLVIKYPTGQSLGPVFNCEKQCKRCKNSYDDVHSLLPFRVAWHRERPIPFPVPPIKLDDCHDFSFRHYLDPKGLSLVELTASVFASKDDAGLLGNGAGNLGSSRLQFLSHLIS